jgi:hypothetical protein
MAGLPTTTEVSNKLTVAGVTFDATLVTQSKIDAAHAWFGHETGYWPFQSSGSDSTETFAPPGREGKTWVSPRGGERILRLKLPLTGNPTTVVAAGTTQVLDTDYYVVRFKPGGPIEALEFAKPLYGLPKSISVTGKWGYCLAADLPALVYEAILDRACGMVLRDTLAMLAQLGSEWSEAQAKEQYDAESMRKFMDMWLGNPGTDYWPPTGPYEIVRLYKRTTDKSKQ